MSGLAKTSENTELLGIAVLLRAAIARVVLLEAGDMGKEPGTPK